MKQTGWVVILQDKTVVEQYPDSGEDNTLQWKELKELDIKQFHIRSPEGHRIGIDLTQRIFIIGDMPIQFISESEELKLVYFLTRQLTTYDLNPDSPQYEQPKIWTVGYEDKLGKVFLSYKEGEWLPLISNCNP